MAGYQNRLDLFSKDMLKRDGDIQDREIMRRHLGIDILSSGVFASGWWDYIDVDSLKVDGPTTSGYVLTADSAGVGTWQESSGGTSDTTVYIKTFTNSDLSSGVLSVSHGLSSTICQVSVFDNSNNFILPDEITLIDANSLTIDLSSFSTISGDWNCIVVSSGGDSTVSNFTDLQDTPSGYSGDADKFLKVDNDASGVVFSLLQENSSGTITASGNIVSTASGSYGIGTANTAFASGVFGTVVTDTLYATDAHIGSNSLYIGDSKLTAPSGILTFSDKDNADRSLSNLYSSGESSGIPTGTLFIWPTDTAPTGYLLCYGQSLEKVGTHAALYAVIGTIFGTVDGNHFSLPDLRGRFPLGKDNMGGVSVDRATDSQADNIGQGSGAEDGVAAHTHPYILVGTNRFSSGSEASGGESPGTTDPTGTLTGNMPPYITMTYIIKY